MEKPRLNGFFPHLCLCALLVPMTTRPCFVIHNAPAQFEAEGVLF